MQRVPENRRNNQQRRSGERQLTQPFVATEEARPDFQEALTVLRVRKWSILAITAAALALALALSTQRTPLYRSESSVLVSPIAVSARGDASRPGPNLATEEQLADSVAVADLVAGALGLQTNPRTLLGNLSVSSPADTEILEFEYVHSDPREAQRLAGAFAEAYLEYRQQTALEASAATEATIEDELRTLRRQERDLLERLDEVPQQDEALRSQIESELALLRGMILQRQLDRVSLPNPSDVGRIVQPADLPTRPFSPNHVLNGSFGLAAGLALGIGLAFTRDRLAGRLRTLEEIEAQLGAPVLGSIPRAQGRGRSKPLVPGRAAPGSPAAEAYRVVRTNLLAAAAANEVRSVLVTSPGRREGRTATIANVGLVLAQADKRVTLVSADLRNPRLHEYFGLPRSPGLAEVLTGKHALGSAMARRARGNLRVLPSGAGVANPAELLDSNAMGNLLEELEIQSDLVILDAPPLLPMSDAVGIAALVDGVLLVVGPKSTTRTAISASRKRLDNVGARLLGAVLNGLEQPLVQPYGR